VYKLLRRDKNICIEKPKKVCYHEFNQADLNEPNYILYL
jgi:hypothetical protein